MTYDKTITLKDGRSCRLRSGTEADGAALLSLFVLTHGQTDYLLTYPDENTLTEDDEKKFLREKEASGDGLELLAELDGRLVASAGFGRVGSQEKLRHRAEFGIAVDRDYWGLGIGRALTEACIACAAAAGYMQLELDVVAGNRAARALYEHEGFVEFGRNPRGFSSRSGGWQELVLMRRELD